MTFIFYQGYWDPNAVDVANGRLVWRGEGGKRWGVNCVVHVNTVIVLSGECGWSVGRTGEEGKRKEVQVE